MSFSPRPALQAAGEHLFHVTRKSLLRANVISLSALGLAFVLSKFPYSEANVMLAVPLLLALMGAVDAGRCMQRTWNFYHGAVILSLYMDILIVTLITFFLLWPYFLWFT